MPLSRLFSLLAPPESEPLPYPFTPGDVARLQAVNPGPAPIDAQTWSDLLLEPYLETLSGQVSIAGRQVLHQRLASGVDGADGPDRVRALMADPPALAALHTGLRPLRRAEAEVATLLFEGTAPAQPRWLRWSALLPVALMGAVLAVAWSPAAWLAAGAVLFILMRLQMQFFQPAEEWKHQLDALRLVLATTALLGDAGRPELTGLAADARKLYGLLGRSGVTALLPGGAAYADWFALANVRHYFHSAARVFAQRNFLRRCYLACGNLEADVALARHLLGRSGWCWSERSAAATLALDNAVHPLMEQARPLSLALADKGAFLSGRNGVGKSTFLRTVGINLIVARAFGFCYAASAALPAVPVHASMRSEDSLLAGESLYIAELRRAKELLAASRRAVPGIFLVDEIFRGTNYLESVSAAAAVLDELAAHSLVLVSSHNLVLAPLLAHRLDPYFIARTGEQLHLETGVLAHTNGISLLADHGFGDGIERNAARVCAWLGAKETAPYENPRVML